MATGSESGAIHIWDLVAGKLWKEFKGHTGAISALEYHPTDIVLASGSHDRSVRLWDVDVESPSAGIIDTCGPDTLPIRAVVFPSSGQTIAAASGDYVRVWAWEPSAQTDIAEASWGKLADLVVRGDSLIGCATGPVGLVSIWALDADQFAGFGTVLEETTTTTTTAQVTATMSQVQAQGQVSLPPTSVPPPMGESMPSMSSFVAAPPPPLPAMPNPVVASRISPSRTLVAPSPPEKGNPLRQSGHRLWADGETGGAAAMAAVASAAYAIDPHASRGSSGGEVVFEGEEEENATTTTTTAAVTGYGVGAGAGAGTGTASPLPISPTRGARTPSSPIASASPPPPTRLPAPVAHTPARTSVENEDDVSEVSTSGGDGASASEVEEEEEIDRRSVKPRVGGGVSVGGKLDSSAPSSSVDISRTSVQTDSGIQTEGPRTHEIAIGAPGDSLAANAHLGPMLAQMASSTYDDHPGPTSKVRRSSDTMVNPATTPSSTAAAQLSARLEEMKVGGSGAASGYGPGRLVKGLTGSPGPAGRVAMAGRRSHPPPLTVIPRRLEGLPMEVLVDAHGSSLSSPPRLVVTNGVNSNRGGHVAASHPAAAPSPSPILTPNPAQPLPLEGQDDKSFLMGMKAEHTGVRDVLETRLGNLRVTRKFWERNDVRGALQSINRAADLSVGADVLSVVAGPRRSTITMVVVLDAIATLQGLLRSPHGRYHLVALDFLDVVLGSPLLDHVRCRPGVSNPPAAPVGMDMAAEDRWQRALDVREGLKQLGPAVAAVAGGGGRPLPGRGTWGRS